MNYSIIIYILGWVMRLEGVAMLVPCIAALVYREESGFVFLICSVIVSIIGMFLTLKKPKNTLFYAREGFVTVALSWVILSLIGAIPFYVSGEIPKAIDALFEVVSGFTTTGASILNDVESLSKCMLLWRSFTHWIGGMGILVFILAILPMTGGQNIHLMRAESPGPSVGKIVPKMQKTAMTLYIIYTVMTIIQMIMLIAGRMPVFDAICTSLGTAGTGGFGIKNDSMAGYSTYIQIVVTVFMFLFGVNFNFYFFLLVKRFKDAVKMEEVRWYFLIFLGSVTAITINITNNISNLAVNIKDAAFQVASIMTTTGFSTVDFDKWPQFSRALLLMLMFIGACAGSTGGGMKVSRIIIYVKYFFKELICSLHSRSVKMIKTDNKALESSTIRTSNGFLVAYLAVLIISFMLLTLNGYDLETCFTSAVTALNNIGPGLNLAGPTCNFSFYSGFSKVVLIFDMLAGRLEIFPMLILFAPQTWKRN